MTRMSGSDDSDERVRLGTAGGSRRRRCRLRVRDPRVGRVTRSRQLAPEQSAEEPTGQRSVPSRPSCPSRPAAGRSSRLNSRAIDGATDQIG